MLQGERTVASVAREFDINANTLGSWVRQHWFVQAEDERSRSQAGTGPDRELEQEKAELWEKLAFLKEAAFFAADHR